MASPKEVKGQEDDERRCPSGQHANRQGVVGGSRQGCSHPSLKTRGTISQKWARAQNSDQHDARDRDDGELAEGVERTVIHEDGIHDIGSTGVLVGLIEEVLAHWGDVPSPGKRQCRPGSDRANAQSHGT